MERSTTELSAAALDTTLYLADRSTRTRTETPHVRGPVDLDTIRQLGVEHMVQQMHDAIALGVGDVRALAASMPNLDALRDSITATHADIIVTPSALDHPRLLDRPQTTSELSHTVKDTAGDRHVVTVHRQGTITLS